MSTPESDHQQAGLPEQVREALVTLQQYLSDQVPPMLFAESLEHLVDLPSGLVGEEIQAWIAAQYRRPSALPISDYLFHAAKKIHVLKELQLVRRDQIDAFLQNLLGTLVEICPPEDRPHLQDDLAHLEDATTVLAAAVDVVHHRVVEHPEEGESVPPALRSALAVAKPRAGPSPSPRAEPTPSLHRFQVLLQRLASEAAPPEVTGKAEVLAEAVAEAVSGAVSPDDLVQRLAGLEQVGAVTSPQRLFQLLASRLPNWAPPPEALATATQRGPAAAMRKAVELAEDKVAAARRLEELVLSAVEEFNRGALGRAVTMLELAQDMVAKHRVTPEVARVLQNRGEALLAPAQLRAYAEDSDKVPLLRRALGFFADLSPAELVAKLEREPSREQRRHLLALLVAHGESARQVALTTLRQGLANSPPIPWQLERNLLYLLRRIPPPADHRPEDELEVLVPLSQPGGPLAVVREALAVLGQMRTPRAEGILIARVAELEEAALGVRPLPYQPVEVLGLLDRAVGALARSSSPSARRCVVAHALKRKAALGNTLARASDLGQQDLSCDPELVDRLVAAVREELPVKVLGVTLASGRKTGAVEGLVALLAGTKAPAVRELFTFILERFPDQPFAQAAARALAGAEPSPLRQPAPLTLSGHLELLGLPSLFQSLADSRLTGALTAMDAAGTPCGTVQFEEGKIVSAKAGPLTGEAAVYQLFLLPISRFVFVQGKGPGAGSGTIGPLEVLPVVMEGVRRLDEYQCACALLPDDVPLRVGSQRPTRSADEPDVTFVRGLWAKVSSGATAAQCEREMGTDFFRVRRLLVHWLLEGAVELADQPAHAPATS